MRDTLHDRWRIWGPRDNQTVSVSYFAPSCEPSVSSFGITDIADECCLRALNLSELLPQACFDNQYTVDENEWLKRCLETCIRTSGSINEHKGAGDHAVTSLAAYHKKLAAMISELKEFLKTIDSQNFATDPSDLMQSVQVGEPILRNQGKLQQQDWGSVDVNVNQFEDICVADDGIQTISSTTGDLIQAKNISVGIRSVQCLGQLSDSSIQRVSGAVIRPR